MAGGAGRHPVVAAAKQREMPALLKVHERSRVTRPARGGKVAAMHAGWPRCRCDGRRDARARRRSWRHRRRGTSHTRHWRARAPNRSQSPRWSRSGAAGFAKWQSTQLLDCARAAGAISIRAAMQDEHETEKASGVHPIISAGTVSTGSDMISRTRMDALPAGQTLQVAGLLQIGVFVGARSAVPGNFRSTREFPRRKCPLDAGDAVVGVRARTGVVCA